MARDLYTVMTRDEAIEQFDNYVLPVVIQLHEQDGQFDECARSEAWNNWTDAMSVSYTHLTLPTTPYV